MLRDLPIENIALRSDAREIMPDAVSGLAESIATLGLLNPIRVREAGAGWEVIAGAHRLAACKSLGLVEITADVVTDDDLHAELAMIDENLCRAELTPVDRARQTARRKAIYLELNPETAEHVAGGVAKNAADNLSAAPSFAAATAAVTGSDERTVRRNAERGAKVIDEVLDMIRGTSLDTGTYLDKLKRMPPNDQVKAATRDLAYERQKNRDQVALARKKKQSADIKAKAAKNFAEWLAEKLGPEEGDWAIATLAEAGASNISTELAGLVGESDRSAA